jgi:hypothetical protein
MTCGSERMAASRFIVQGQKEAELIAPVRV